MSETATRLPTPDDDAPRATSADAEYPRDVDELHDRLVRWFEESEMARQDEIALAQRDRDYVDHEQFTREERKILNERGQPIITINKIADKLQLLCGMERKAAPTQNASRARRPRKTAPTPPPSRCATSATTTRSH